MSAVYEVKVEGVTVEYYNVKATSPEHARDIWATGELLSQEGYSYEVVGVEEAFDQEWYGSENLDDYGYASEFFD